MKALFPELLQFQLENSGRLDINHNVMSPVKSDNYRSAPKTAKKAAVLAIVFYDTAWKIIFIERSSKYKNDKHAGQISFPGGQLEKNEDLLSCAMRETREEIGIETSDLIVLGSLTELYVSVSNFIVSPFVAYAPRPLSFKKSDDEVKTIIQHPLEKLLHKDARLTTSFEHRNNYIKDVPYYDIASMKLWGATAIITHELLEHIKSIDFRNSE